MLIINESVKRQKVDCSRDNKREERSNAKWQSILRLQEGEIGRRTIGLIIRCLTAYKEVGWQLMLIPMLPLDEA